jgi:hypothetical protein
MIWATARLLLITAGTEKDNLKSKGTCPHEFVSKCFDVYCACAVWLTSVLGVVPALIGPSTGIL